MNTFLKTTYTLIGAAILLSACSNESDMPGGTDGQDRRIVFKTSLPVITSRGNLLDKNNLPKYFQVTAFDPQHPEKIKNGKLEEFFSNKRIDITDAAMHSSEECIWPEPGYESHELTFYSFYPALDVLGTEEKPAVLSNNSTPAAFDYKLEGFTVKPDIAGHVDFMTATATGTMEDNLFSGIRLDFGHILAAIEIKVYGEHKSCDIEIAGVRLGGVGVSGSTFDLVNNKWLNDNLDRGIVEYIYTDGDKIVACGKNNKIPLKDNALSIMGKGGYAMLIPAEYPHEWDLSQGNTNKGMYISVLLRVTDATPTANIKPEESQRYPYRDLAHGKDALDVPILYIVVDKSTGIVSTRVYKKGDKYYTDKECKNSYPLEGDMEVREFGWAAIPVTASWEPGKIYTYTLDYTSGVGVHDQEITTGIPKAGDPVISDKVGVSYSVKEWLTGGGSNVEVPGS